MRGCAVALVVVVTACTGSSPVPTCTECGGACVDTLSDSSHCGTCAASCDAGTRCELGICTATCAGLDCEGLCVDPQSDALNCSACGYVCEAQHAGALCIAGRCSHAPCDVGWYDCDFDETNGCESQSADCVTDVCGLDANESEHVCTLLAISSDGRRVLFSSFDTFDAADSPDSLDLFVYETRTAAIRRLILPGASQSDTTLIATGGMSGDGNTVVFVTSIAAERVQLTHLDTDETSVLPDDAGLLWEPGSAPLALSYDGTKVALSAFCPPGIKSTNSSCAARLDAQTGAAFILPFDGNAGVALSADGQTLAFVDGGLPYLANAASGAIVDAISRSDGGFDTPNSASVVSMSLDGSLVAVQTADDIIWVGSAGKPLGHRDAGSMFSGTSPTLSYDGRLLAFTNLSNLCEVRDLDAGVDAYTADPQFFDCVGMLSGDGRTLAVTTGPSQIGVIHLVHVNRP